MMLSERFKHAVKTGLAMVIAYGVALSLDWDNPYWAGLAVGMCCLSTTGESINKGLLRLFGTFVAILATLTLIALFPQDRWLFLLVMSLYTAFCTYMMVGTARWYFWFVAGFSVPLLAMAGGPIALNAFGTVILRAQETALGVVAYSLVWLFLWPSSSRGAFEGAVRALVEVQRELFARDVALATGKPDDGSAQRLIRQATQTQARLKGLLGGAELDSYDVWETRYAWRRCIGELVQLTDALERWRQGFAEIRAMDLPRFIPELATFGLELDHRLAEILRMLAGQPPERSPVAVELRLETGRLGSLSHFHRAALLLYRDQMAELDRLTCDLFETVGDIRGFFRAQTRVPSEAAPPLPAALDPERLASVARQFAGLWLALLAAIYVPDLPNAVAFIAITNSALMALALMPQVPVTAVFLPAAFSVCFGGAIHILVLPHLSSFAGLALVIFGAVFFICYTFHRPEQEIAKSMALSLFVVLVDITNEQQYSFLRVVNFAMVLPLVFTAIAVATHVPVSFRPERVFRRLLGRFFRSCTYLASTLQWDPGYARTRRNRLQRAFHAHNVAIVPGKLAVWGHALPAQALGNTTPEQVTSLQALAYRMEDLIAVRDHPQAAVLVRELLADVRAWRLGIQEAFQKLSRDPMTAEHASFRSRLDAKLEQLEARVEGALDRADETSVSAKEGESMYRLLGAYRGVSEAMVETARCAAGFDWRRLREARF